MEQLCVLPLYSGSLMFCQACAPMMESKPANIKLLKLVRNIFQSYGNQRHNPLSMKSTSNVRDNVNQWQTAIL